jgi:hypothetical protein
VKNRTNRLNRWLLSILGTLLLVLGVGGVLMGTHTFGDNRANSSIVYPRAAQLLHREQDWLWWVLGTAALLIALAALYWAVVQFRTERITSVLVQQSINGDSIVQADALCDAVHAEAETLPGVARARARLTNDRNQPELVLSVWLAEEADLAAVRHTLETRVLPHAQESLDIGRLHTWLRIEVDASTRERVQ